MLCRMIQGAGVLALTLGISGVSLGQPPAKQEWSVLTFSQIKPEFRAEYEAAQKEVTAAYKKAGVQSRVVVQTILGDLAEYVSVAPLSKFAEMDGPSPMVKALGDAGSQRLIKRLSSYLNTIHRVTALSIPDLSIQTPTENPAEYAVVTTWRLAPGKNADFAAFMKEDYLPAMRKADVANFWVSRPVFGGDLSERYTVRPLRKIGDLDAGPLLNKALGQEKAAQVNMKLSKIVDATHYSVVRLRMDLSYMPPPPKPAGN